MVHDVMYVDPPVPIGQHNFLMFIVVKCLCKKRIDVFGVPMCVTNSTWWAKVGTKHFGVYKVVCVYKECAYNDNV